MKKLMMMLAALLLAGCEPEPTRYVRDQCLRAELFARCLAALPAGPVATKYNDWDEVVKACEGAAYWQSVRARSAATPECAVDAL